MKLRCPACVKHIGCALLALIVLLLSLEAGLRIYDDRTGKITGRDESLAPLLTPSARTFQRLRPVTVADVTNPDTGRAVSVNTNSLGLRGAEIAVPKPAGVYRVLILGDELTFAAELPENETVCARLQPLLQARTGLKVDVVNGGVPGYCPLLSYLLLKHSLLGLQPDLIVLNFSMDDVADDHRLRRFARLGAGGEPLLCRHPDFETSQDRRSRSRRQCLLRMWAARQIGRFTTSQGDRAETDDISSPAGRYAWVKDRPPDWSVYIEQAFFSLNAIRDLSRKMRADFIVAAVPAPWQVSEHATNAVAVRQSAGIPSVWFTATTGRSSCCGVV